MAQSFKMNYAFSKLLRLIKFNFIVFFLLSNLLMINKLNAQENPLALTSSDNKKLDKAAKEAAKADDKTKEADKIFADVAAKQSELTSEETDKMNNKAIGYQVEALQFKYNSDKMKYEVYSAKTSIFWDKYKGTPESAAYPKSLETEAKANFSLAEGPYNESKSEEDNLLKYSKLSTATDYTSKAFEKMKQAYEMYSNLIQNPVTSEPMEQPVINDEQVAMPVDSSLMGTKPVQESPQENIQETLPPAIVEDTPKTEEVNVMQEAPVEAFVEEKPTPVVEPITQTYIPVANISSSGNFRVQIAASRVPLCKEQLQKIYAGSEESKEELINEWYKYSIGPFADLSAAMEFRNSCGVKGAFIVQR